MDSSGPGQRPVAGSCGQGIEPSVSVKCLELLEWVSDCLLLKDSIPWSEWVSQ
jgi:hypothetical protein